MGVILRCFDLGNSFDSAEILGRKKMNCKSIVDGIICGFVGIMTVMSAVFILESKIVGDLDSVTFVIAELYAFGILYLCAYLIQNHS